jgi:hypothetical protein
MILQVKSAAWIFALLSASAPSVNTAHAVIGISGSHDDIYNDT